MKKKKTPRCKFCNRTMSEYSEWCPNCNRSSNPLNNPVKPTLPAPKSASSRPIPSLRPKSAPKENDNFELIEELQGSCGSCGKSWCFNEQDVKLQQIKALKNIGKSMLAIGGSMLAGIMPNENVTEHQRCPSCGSRVTKILKVTNKRYL